MSVRAGALRSRWAAIGAAVAVTLGGGGLFAVHAAGAPTLSVVVTIDPVRILDTRTDVGLAGPFVSPVSQRLQVTGTAGVPSGATDVLLNVTAVQPQANGFVSIRRGDATGVPTTSSLNANAGDIVANAVQVGLPTSGANAGQIEITFDAYGEAGPSTEMLIDVVGYMIPGGGGATGAPGDRGVSAWDSIPSGQTVTGEFGFTAQYVGPMIGNYSISLPAKAPVALTSENVNFAADSLPGTVDDDLACTGTASQPSAPAGKVCLYAYDSTVPPEITDMQGFQSQNLGDQAFYVAFRATGSPATPSDLSLFFTWAYTAP